MSCLEVIVPDGGYLDPSGNSWSCHRGYMKVDDICLEIVLPPNPYLADNSFGSVWLYDWGFEVDGEICTAIAVTECYRDRDYDNVQAKSASDEPRRHELPLNRRQREINGSDDERIVSGRQGNKGYRE